MFVQHNMPAKSLVWEKGASRNLGMTGRSGKVLTSAPAQRVKGLAENGRALLGEPRIMEHEVQRVLGLEWRWLREVCGSLLEIFGNRSEGDELTRTGPQPPLEASPAEEGHYFEQRMANRLKLLGHIQDML